MPIKKNKKKTPEERAEIERDFEARKAAVAARQKESSEKPKIGRGVVGRRDVAELAAIQRGEEGFASKEEEEAAVETEARETKSRQFFEKKGFFEEEAPQRVELDIPKKEAGIFTDFPVIGPGAQAVGGQVIEALAKVKIKNRPLVTPETQAIMVNDPELRMEMAKVAITEDTKQEGLSAGEKFGTLIEAIPVVGSLAGKYVSGLIEDPRGNVQTIVTHIASERERASVLAEKLATGKIDPYTGFEELESMQDNVNQLESRMQLLMISSPQLRADPDTVNLIEEQILRARERIFMAKGAAAQGATIAPTEASWYYTLQNLKAEP